MTEEPFNLELLGLPVHVVKTVDGYRNQIVVLIHPESKADAGDLANLLRQMAASHAFVGQRFQPLQDDCGTGNLWESLP
jgi:hypothetical protein